MADFTEIIQEINTNLPDNNTQSITAEKLRTTLIDLTNTIDTVQDDFETGLNNEFDALEEHINETLSQGVVDNLNSTSSTSPLAANQGRILNEKIEGSATYTYDNYSYSDFNLTTNNVATIGTGNVSTFSSALGKKITIDETVKEIRCKVIKSSYYYGVCFYSSSTQTTTTFISGIVPTSESVELVITDIPANAKSALISIRTSMTSAYANVKKLSAITPGLEERMDNAEQSIEEIESAITSISSSSLYNGIVSPSSTAESLSDTEELHISGFPQASKSRGETVTFRANVTTFNKILIGKSSMTVGNGFGSAYSSWLEIDNTNIKIIKNATASSSNTPVTSKTIAHGLTIQDTINVMIAGKDDGGVHIELSTVGNKFTTNVNLYGGDGGTLAWLSNNYGYYKVRSNGSSLTNCKITVANKYIRKPLWIFGASYESTHDSTCWPYYAFQSGFQDYYINASPGRASTSAYNDLVRALNFGTPKFLLWTMWGNGTSQELDTYIQNVLDLCNEKGITLIIVNRPNSSASSISSAYTAKKAVINKYINLGVRYWDIAAAVSYNPSASDGWYTGYLQSDGVHPTALGSKAIASQFFIDIPEAMQY